jgi:hypothetical protein
MRALLAAAAVLLAAAPAAAQPSASHRAAAAEVIEASGSRDTYLRAMELGMAEGGMGEMTPELQAAVREILNDLFRFEDLLEPFIELYTELYTEEELRQIAAVYRTPGGRLLVEKGPELAVGSQAIVQARLADVMPQMMERIMAAVEAEEDN